MVISIYHVPRPACSPVSHAVVLVALRSLHPSRRLPYSTLCQSFTSLVSLISHRGFSEVILPSWVSLLFLCDVILIDLLL